MTCATVTLGGHDSSPVGGPLPCCGVARVQLSDGKTLQLDLPSGKVVANTARVARTRGTSSSGSSDAGGDQEQRLKSLEEKLDRLMKEVERLNQNQNQNRQS